MTAEDLGTELWTLAHHLYQTASSPKEAFRELTLRTGTVCTQEDLVTATTASRLLATSWFTIMRDRYAQLRADLSSQHASDIAETVDIVKSLYPGGCSVSEYADAVQTCAAMVSFTIANEKIVEFVAAQSDAILESHAHEIGVDALTSGIVDGLLITAMVPSRWWVETAKMTKPSLVAQARRVGLRVDPPELAIEYERPVGVVRRRCIYLRGLLHASGPTGPLARRLSASHDALLPETELQKLLMKLQRLMSVAADEKSVAAPGERVGKEEEAKEKSKVLQEEQQQQQTHGNAYSPPPSPSTKSKAGTGQKGSGAPQKADLGLLYRDPEKALENVDLNDADDITLKEFKEVMNERFKENAIKPGDASYVYDKRVAIAAPTQKSEWDDSDGD